MNLKQERDKRCWTILRPAILILSLVIFAVAGTNVWGQETQGGAPSNRDSKAETVNKITAPFTVAAVGDIIEPQPLYRSDPRFHDLLEHMRKADVGFANMESSLVDFAHFTGGVEGTVVPLEVGAAMKAMGITMVNRANNHTFDGGIEGMRSTDVQLDKLGIAHAGTGRDLQEARGAAFQETPKGRVGLVGMFATDTGGGGGTNYGLAAATLRNGDLGGTPGENQLHVTTYRIISPEQMQQLKNLAGAVGGKPAPEAATQAGSGPDRFKFYDDWFQAGPNPGGLSYEMNAKEEKEILASIRNGKIYADFMIATIHAHQTTTTESQGRGGVDHAVADFLIKLAHDCVDNGADMFVAHGVHVLHGIEIYKGKPIFFGVSNFVLQSSLEIGDGYDMMANARSKAYLEDQATQEAVLTTSHFEGGKLTEVRIYPVDLGGARRPISQVGIPMTPSPQDAQRILKEMQEYSKLFGTAISIEDNVGVIRVNDLGQSIAVAR